MSDPSASVSRCDRCRVDPAADPCDDCPLRGAFAERGGDPAAYAAWATAGGWRLVWTLGDLNRRREARIAVLALMGHYPAVRPAIVAHHLEVR